MTLISLIPFWPWLFMVIVLIIAWAFWRSIKLNNLVKQQRHEISQVFVDRAFTLSSAEWDAMCKTIDNVSWMTHLKALRNGDDWKDLYRPAFFGEKQ